MSREMKIKFKCQSGAGRPGSEYWLTSLDSMPVTLPSQAALNEIFQEIAASEAKKIGRFRGDLEVLETIPQGVRILLPGGYPGWFRSRFCAAVSRILI